MAWQQYKLPHELENTYLTRARDSLKAGNYAKAEKEFQLVLRSQEINRGKISPEAAETLGNLGLTAELSKDYVKAKQYYEQAIDVGQKHFKGRDNALVPLNQLGLARIELRNGNLPTYEAATNAALKVLENGDVRRFGNYVAQNIAQAHRTNVAVLKQQGKDELSQKEIDRAIEIDNLIKRTENIDKKDLEQQKPPKTKSEDKQPFA